ncbi:kinase-like domain-containing protein [Rostrohypoxylon terebratum]|nr:kinase-like domain-containing protein [Rostrohypoxylon terebratum]
MSVRQLIQSLPDIVRDSRLETEFFDGYTQHIVYVSGHSARERHVPKEERWVRKEFLGQGAYGTVHLEQCKQGDGSARLRAVKQIKKYNVAGKELEYLRELEAISKFSHNRYSHCFVRSDGWFENAESVFITMEYLENRDLQRYLNKPLPESEARTITSQVLEGLKFMHDNGFVHRDLKPGNIMVVETGPSWFVKIADFGISKRRQQDVTSLHTTRMGTLGFAAPETMRLSPGNKSRSYTAAVDLWSLGACVHMMLVGGLPFLDIGEVFQYVNGMLTFPRSSLQSRSITDEGQQFIMTLMSPDPTTRPSSEVADRHPWITTDLPAHSGDFNSSNTMLSVASAAWTPIAEQVGDPLEDSIKSSTEKQVEEPSETKTAMHLRELRKTSIPLYRSPYVESCDEYEETDGKRLPSDSPYVLEDADTSDTMSYEVSSSGSSVISLEETTNSLISISMENLAPNMISRPRSPYFVQVGEKTYNSPSPKRGRSKSTTGNENGFKHDGPSNLKHQSQHYRRSSVGESYQSPITLVSPVDTTEEFGENTLALSLNNSQAKSEHEVSRTSMAGDEGEKSEADADDNAFLLYTEPKSNPEAEYVIEPEVIDFEEYQRKLLYATRYRTITCAFCSSQYHINDRKIRLVPCGHWICHCCLVERFAFLLLVGNFHPAKDLGLRCCSKNINLKSFNRILIDHKLNQLWSTRFGKDPTYEDRLDAKNFIMYLYESGVLRNPEIKKHIQRYSGLIFDQPRIRIREPREGPKHTSNIARRNVTPKRRIFEDSSSEDAADIDTRYREPLRKKYYSLANNSYTTRPRYDIESERDDYGEDIMSEEEVSDSDTPMYTMEVTLQKRRDVDVITHNGGSAGRHEREGMSYQDIFSWRNHVGPPPYTEDDTNPRPKERERRNSENMNIALRYLDKSGKCQPRYPGLSRIPRY